MFIELHILQNFVPSNLNRSDTNAPKDCEFGGYRRARISSQCLKRAMREEFKKDSLLGTEHLGTRTKLLAGALAKIMAKHGKPPDEAREVAEVAIAGLELAPDSKNPDKTQYLLFLGNEEIEGLARTCLDHWEEMRNAAAAVATGGDKKKKKAAVPDDVQKALAAVLNGGKAADVALFGRMLADLPEKNVDAASQVAHAISTNRVETEFDFYTAVDDIRPEDTAGADMLGTVEFNSACFYRYVNVDTGELLHNLGGDADLARETVRAWIEAGVRAIPTGKQNSMAAHNPPSLVFAVVRERGLQNLANAFVEPVRPDRDGDLVDHSVRRLGSYWSELQQMYGENGARTWVSSTQRGVGSLGSPVPLPDLVEGVVEAAASGVAI